MPGPAPERTSGAGVASGSAQQLLHALETSNLCFGDLVVIARGNTPDPIPNSAVKTLSANGTPS